MKMKWIGPFKIMELLEKCFDESRKPPEDNKAVYLVSKNKWEKIPNKDCEPLYVGSTTGKSKRFRTRVGDLLADMFGFYGEETGHHSGGKSINGFCRENNINPLGLYIGWTANTGCIRCAENKLFDDLEPKLNQNRPKRCDRRKKI